jgi:hypothetical protein
VSEVAHKFGGHTPCSGSNKQRLHRVWVNMESSAFVYFGVVCCGLEGAPRAVFAHKQIFLHVLE